MVIACVSLFREHSVKSREHSVKCGEHFVKSMEHSVESREHSVESTERFVMSVEHSVKVREHSVKFRVRSVNFVCVLSNESVFPISNHNAAMPYTWVSIHHSLGDIKRNPFARCGIHKMV
jgi:hypothetical protein